MRSLRTVTAMLAPMLALSAFAQPTPLTEDMQYICKIAGVTSLKNGVLVGDQGSLYRIYRDSNIYIDRRSGEITGPWMLDVKASEYRIKELR